MLELSILIPARNEEFLSRTVNGLLENMRADTEIIAVLDGVWADPPIQRNEKVTVVYVCESVGQRAALNLAAKIAGGTYFMKLDAHCLVDEGFDRKILDDIEHDWTMAPNMKNLHAFDWICLDCDWR